MTLLETITQQTIRKVVLNPPQELMLILENIRIYKSVETDCQTIKSVFIAVKLLLYLI